MAYAADDLLTMIRLRGAVPAVQGLWQSTDFLLVADQEIQSYVIPLVHRVQEEYYVQTQDYAIAPVTPIGQPTGTQYRIPYRAIGGALRDIYLLDLNGNPINIPRGSLDDLEQASWGVYFMGNVVNYVNKTTYATPVTLRMVYYLRPSRLVLQANAAQVASFSTSGFTITLGSPPAAYTGNTSWDIIRAKPGFEMLGFDLSGTLTGSTISFSGPLPTDLAVGDWVCLPEQSPVLQVPAELHPLVAERVTMKYLQASGDAAGVQASMAILQRMEADALTLISGRMGGEVKKIVTRNSVWRRWRR